MSSKTYSVVELDFMNIIYTNDEIIYIDKEKRKVDIFNWNGSQKYGKDFEDVKDCAYFHYLMYLINFNEKLAEQGA